LLRRLGSAEVDMVTARLEAKAVEARASTDARQFENEIAVLRTLADADPLSGLLNRRGFTAFAEDAMRQFGRYQRPFGVLMLDIDHFKKVNDTHGHAAGDDAIRALSRLVREHVRDTDKAARFGGEEFIVLLHETDEHGMARFANRLRLAVEAMHLSHAGQDFRITLSGGGALARMQDRDVQDVIERADRALYAAKISGRNRVVIGSGAAQEQAAA